MKIDSRRQLKPAYSNVSTDETLDRYPEGRANLERLQKGNDFHFVGGVQRVCGTVASLHRSGDISDSHVAAADRWYRDYVLGVMGAHDPEAVRTGKAPDAHAAMLSKVAACARHRQIREALGLCSEVRLRLMLVDELSFSSMAAKLMPGDVNGRKKVAAQMVFLLEQLAEHYQAVDRQLTQ